MASHSASSVFRRPTFRRQMPRSDRRRRRTACLVLLALVGLRIGAKEVDSFTHRYEILALPAGEFAGRPLTDFAPVLDARVNRIVADVLARRNAENRRAGRSCDSRRARKRLFTKLRHALGGPLIVTRNRLRPAINRHPNRVKIPLRRSVYRDFPPWRSPTLALVSRVRDVMADAFRFDLELVGESAGSLVRRRTPVLVSSDKITHFFNRSQRLFDRLGAGRPADLDRVLAYNQHLEASIWGTRTTGVGAWGDLVANFQGMRFWIHLLGVDVVGRPVPDPLAGPGEEAVEPLVRCTARGWEQARELTLGSYLDPAWDEGLNCSDYRDPDFLAAFERRIAELNRNDPHGRFYGCPMDPDLIRRAAERYGAYADRLINLEGPRVYRPILPSR